MSVYEKLEGQEKSEFRIMLLEYIDSANTDPEIMWKLVETLEDSRMLFFTQSRRHPIFSLAPRHPLTYGKKIKFKGQETEILAFTYSGVKMELCVAPSRSHEAKVAVFVKFSPPLTDKTCRYSLEFILDEHPYSSKVYQEDDYTRQKNTILSGSLTDWGWPNVGIEVGKCYVVLFTFNEFVKI